MVGQMVEDLSRGQSIAVQLLFNASHGHLSGRVLILSRGSQPKRGSENRSTKMLIINDLAAENRECCQRRHFLPRVVLTLRDQGLKCLALRG